MERPTPNPYIAKYEGVLQGEPVIAGSRTPVRAVVENYRMGLRPEEIRIAFPHLRLAQIFGALSYYFDNEAEIQQYIEANRVPEDLLPGSKQAL